MCDVGFGRGKCPRLAQAEKYCMLRLVIGGFQMSTSLMREMREPGFSSWMGWDRVGGEHYYCDGDVGGKANWFDDSRKDLMIERICPT